jgi:hypothetical protein
MRLIDINYPHYRLQHRSGCIFDVLAFKLDDGRLTFDPIKGWDGLSFELQQDPESLLEDIDDAIYNATPERYEND